MGTNALLRKFPQEYVDQIMKHEDEGTTTSEEYQKLIVPFSRKHQCAMDPWPEELNQSFQSIEEDPTVAMAMSARFLLFHLSMCLI
jgi:hypothetical protein